MKKISLLLFFFVTCFSFVYAQQEAEGYLKEAQEYIKAKNLKEARLSIQQALANINTFTGKEILKVLPAEFNGMKPSGDYDDYINLYPANGDGGMSVSRTYKKDKEDYKNYFVITVYVTSIGTNAIKDYLNDPTRLNPKSEKIIKLSNGKKTLGRFYSDSEEYKSGSLDIPFNDFYISIFGYGTESKEDALIKCASKIDFEKLRKAAGEQ